MGVEFDLHFDCVFVFDCVFIVDFFVFDFVVVVVVVISSFFHAEFHGGHGRQRGGDGEERARSAGAARKSDLLEQMERLRCT